MTTTVVHGGAGGWRAEPRAAALDPVLTAGRGGDGSVTTPFTTAAMPRATRIGDRPPTVAGDG